MFVALDRDGTLIEHVPYLVDPARVQVNPRAARGIRQLNTLGIPVVVVTNQSVIGRGLASRETVEEIHAEITTQLKALGAVIDGYFLCPHSADGECECRKPKPGLIHDAARLLEMTVSDAVVIGDSWRDMQLAKDLGVWGLHVQTGPEPLSTPHPMSFSDVLSAIEYLLHNIV